jgi:hypothetical protein
VTKTFRTRSTVLAVGLALTFGLGGARAPAALDLNAGAREVVKNEPVSDCNAKAKSALNAVLQNAAEIGSGDTGEWRAYGAPDSTGNSFAAAAVHCYPLDDVSGYLVTFTCAAQTPPNPDAANAICEKLAASFGGQP